MSHISICLVHFDIRYSKLPSFGVNIWVCQTESNCEIHERIDKNDFFSFTNKIIFFLQFWKTNNVCKLFYMLQSWWPWMKQEKGFIHFKILNRKGKQKRKCSEKFSSFNIFFHNYSVSLCSTYPIINTQKDLLVRFNK